MSLKRRRDSASPLSRKRLPVEPIKVFCRDLQQSPSCDSHYQPGTILSIRGMVIGFTLEHTINKGPSKGAAPPKAHCKEDKPSSHISQEKESSKQEECLVLDDGSGGVAILVLSEHIQNNDKFMAKLVPGLIVECLVTLVINSSSAESEEDKLIGPKGQSESKTNHDDTDNNNSNAHYWRADAMTVWTEQTNTSSRREENNKIEEDDSLGLLWWHSTEISMAVKQKEQHQQQQEEEQQQDSQESRISNSQESNPATNTPSLKFGYPAMNLSNLQHEVCEMIHSGAQEGVSLQELATVLDLPVPSQVDGSTDKDDPLRDCLAQLQLAGRIYHDPNTSCYHPL